MGPTPPDYVERIYAGCLGKAAGIIYGAPIEMWNDEKIRTVYGELKGYVRHYRRFAADDDWNGPAFFIRALEDSGCEGVPSPEQIAEAWLNYAPYEHGFYWWGGYGISTEHTVYLNLANGIPAPESGSIAQNGQTLAEQIGGQIFIDTWGMIAPNREKLAAEYARSAASVSHDGNGVYGGMFVAACVSAAFGGGPIAGIVNRGLAVIPQDCEYARMVRAVQDFHKAHQDSWRDCLLYIQTEWWTNRYGGNCHIIPNGAILVLSLLYGGGDFSRTLDICCMCGFDTDCNAGNAGAILGVLTGLTGVQQGGWLEQIQDFMACSSVIGSLNAVDMPSFALYLAGLGQRAMGEPLPEKWCGLLTAGPRAHFELPGSTHGICARVQYAANTPVTVRNTDLLAYSGSHCLCVTAAELPEGGILQIYQKTYYSSADFSDSRYDPAFSPLLYPGQEVSLAVRREGKQSISLFARLFVKNHADDSLWLSEEQELPPDAWAELRFCLPIRQGACLEEAGVQLRGCRGTGEPVVVYLDDLRFEGMADTVIDFTKVRIDAWHRRHWEIEQFTRWKGIWELEAGKLAGSCADSGETYTGDVRWEGYCFLASIAPVKGGWHGLLFRVQGACRCYALALLEGGRLALLKKEKEFHILAQVDFEWDTMHEYPFEITLQQNRITVESCGCRLLQLADQNRPYLNGMVGAAVRSGSRSHFGNFHICPNHTMKSTGGEVS